MRQIAHRLQQALLVLAVVALTLVGGASAASAHAVIESTTPISNAVLEQSPSEVMLDFNEPINTSLGWVRVFDGDANRVAAASLDHGTNNTVVKASLPALNDGGYLVVWRVVSADGHPVEGAFGFQVGSSSSPVDPGVVSTVVSDQSTSEVPGRILGVSRYVAYLAIAALVGLLLIGAADPERQRRWFARTAGVAAIATLGMFFSLGPYSNGSGGTKVFDLSIASESLDTRTGAMTAVRVVLLAGLAVVGIRIPSRIRYAFLSLIALSVAIGSHAAAQSPAAVAVLISAIHVFAVWAWIGAIFVLLAFRSSPHFLEQVRRFSGSMNIVLPAVVASGVLTALKNLDGFENWLDTTYGRIVLAKMLIVLLMAVVGYQVRRDFLTGPRAKATILKFEALFALVAFVLAALLAVTPPVSSSATSNLFHESLVEAGLLADITIDPTHVGSNEVHLLFSPPGGTLAPVTDVQVRFSLPARSIPNVKAVVTQVSPNHWIGVMNIPYDGTWKVELLVKPTPTETVRYVLEIPISE